MIAYEDAYGWYETKIIRMNKRNLSGAVYALLTAFSAVWFVSCGGNDENKADLQEVQLEMVEPADTVHTSQNSLDYAGTYKGVTPCADCEGIEVALSIAMDSTYTLSAKYLGKGDGKPVVTNGKYVWIDGGTIQLEGINSGPSKYKVGEGRIWQLDMQGNRIEGALADKYMLTKTN